MRRRHLLSTLAVACAALPARATPDLAAAELIAARTDRPDTGAHPVVVVELFTSQGCSSCPPAEAFLSELARTRPDILALSFHVTYWNSLGWRDPFSLEAATARQHRYAALLSSDVYTPQMVIGGRRDVVGSDRARALDSIARTAEAVSGHPALQAALHGGTVEISVGAGEGNADLLLVGYDREHRTAVGRGENAGRSLTETNIVRSVATIAAWIGMDLRLAVPLPTGEQVAVLLQSPDGAIRAAARAG